MHIPENIYTTEGLILGYTSTTKSEHNPENCGGDKRTILKFKPELL